MKYKCLKCNNKFSSEYMLNKHMNKQVPCDIKIECDKCGLSFTSKIYLERHKNRKTPCIKNMEVTINIPQVSKSDEKQKNRLKIEKEKTKQLELKLKEKTMEIEAQKELKLLEIEALKLRNDSRLKEEEMKTERKEKTTHIINNQQNITIQNNFVLNIQNKYVTDYVIAIESEEFKEYENDIYKIAIDKKLLFNRYLFDTSKNINEFISIFLRLLFNCESKIDYKNMFYSRDLNAFFGIFKILIEGNEKECYKEIREISYENHIDPIFRPIIQTLLEYMKDAHRKEPGIEDKNYMKYIDMNNNKKKVLESLQELAKDILYDSNMITKKEYIEIRKEFKEHIN